MAAFHAGLFAAGRKNINFLPIGYILLFLSNIRHGGCHTAIPLYRPADRYLPAFHSQAQESAAHAI
ncbi:MAG: hypothetical protein RSD99_18630, partial [Janthinobacterium sp.]